MIFSNWVGLVVFRRVNYAKKSKENIASYLLGGVDCNICAFLDLLERVKLAAKRIYNFWGGFSCA
jgi:hypothetical protein